MSPAPDAWTPILAGHEARPALDAVVDIADALAVVPPNPGGDPSLASGSAGLALALHELHRVVPERRYREAARRHLVAALRRLVEVPLPGRFLSGLGGVAWAASWLRAPLEVDDGDALMRQIDEALTSELSPSFGRGRYDLGSGVVGWGLYATAPRPWPGDPRLLSAIVTRLESFAAPGPGRTPWFTPHEALSDTMKGSFPAGHHDLGLAHGVAGPLAWLCSLPRQGDAWARAEMLATGALRWLLLHRTSTGFPAFVEHAGPARAAWCYGDPGIAVALAAARRLGGENLIIARDVAEQVAARPPAQTGVADAGFCHGASGLAHIYHRIARVTGSPVLLDAARAWLDRVLCSREPGRGVGGFRSYVREPSGGSWCDDPGLLTGSAGIALVLAAAISVQRPRWDRAFLLAMEDADDAQ